MTAHLPASPTEGPAFSGTRESTEVSRVPPFFEKLEKPITTKNVLTEPIESVIYEFVDPNSLDSAASLTTEASMPIQRQPFYPFDTLFLFPYYSTREEYEKATGRPAPPWDETKPPKYWFDPKAPEAPRKLVVYDTVLAISENGTLLRDETTNQPLLDMLVLTKEHAAVVNIPAKGVAAGKVPNADQPEVPMPLRPLLDYEELFFRFGGTIAVRDKEYYAQTQVGFTSDDRDLIKAIAAKLGV